MIGFSPRRSLTAHQDWKEVLETLRAKFHTYVSLLPNFPLSPFDPLTPSSNNLLMLRSVKLPKSFVAIDLSEQEAFERRGNGNGNGNGNNQKKENVEPEASTRGRSEERRASTDTDILKTELPPPVLDT